MKKPFISVIIIGYNIEAYVDACIVSVLDQDYEDYEIIFVDDGSTDHTSELVRKYVERNQVKMISKRNGGRVSARKTGVMFATGIYVTFIDGDDWIGKTLLSDLASCVHGQGKDFDIVSGDISLQVENMGFEVVANQNRKPVYEGKMFFRQIMLDQLNHHMFPKLYKREFLMNSGFMLLPEMPMAEDLMANAFLGLHNPEVCFSDTNAYFYRYNPSSTTHRGSKMLLRQMDTLQYMEQYFEVFSDKETFSKLMEYQWFSYVFTYVRGNDAHKTKKKIMTMCKKRIQMYKDNSFCMEELKRCPWYTRSFFWGYYYASWLMCIVNPLLIYMRKVVKKRRYIAGNR